MPGRPRVAPIHGVKSHKGLRPEVEPAGDRGSLRIEKGSAGSGGKGGGEYGRITGQRRRDGSRPAGCDYVLQACHHGYAVARTGPAAWGAGLELRDFWKSASCCRAISIAWVMT